MVPLPQIPRRLWHRTQRLVRLVPAFGTRSLSEASSCANEEIAKLREKSALLEKQNAELNAQARLGTSRFDKALQGGQTRAAEIASALMRKCSPLDQESAHLFASCIDLFEDFGNPHRLSVEARWFLGLIVRFGSKSGWAIQFGPYHTMSKEMRKALLDAVEIEIKTQKEKHFPARGLIENACEKHFSQVPRRPSGNVALTPSEMSAYLAKATEPFEDVKLFSVQVTNALAQYFRELEQAKLDVEAVLLDSWQPMEMRRVMWMYSYLINYSQAVSVGGLPPDFSLSQQQRDIWELYVSFFRYMRMVAATVRTGQVVGEATGLLKGRHQPDPSSQGPCSA